MIYFGELFTDKKLDQFVKGKHAFSVYNDKNVGTTDDLVLFRDYVAVVAAADSRGGGYSRASFIRALLYGCQLWSRRRLPGARPVVALNRSAARHPPIDCARAERGRRTSPVVARAGSPECAARRSLAVSPPSSPTPSTALVATTADPRTTGDKSLSQPATQTPDRHTVPSQWSVIADTARSACRAGLLFRLS